MFPTFDVAEIAEEAAERAGVDLRGGYALRSARRSIEILSIEWGNRGLNLWTVADEVMPLSKGVKEYPLPADTIDLIEHMLRYPDTSGLLHDYPMARYSLSDYAAIPAKDSDGRPTAIRILRKIAPGFLVWPVPDTDNYSIAFSRLVRMASVGQGGTGEPDMPWRFVPAMTAGLAYYLALKSTKPDAAQRVPVLKLAYDEQFALASDEDRDRASVRWVPWGYPL